MELVYGQAEKNDVLERLRGDAMGGGGPARHAGMPDG
jgi:hypothetical protein